MSMRTVCLGDRRPLNAGERQPGPVRLPYAPRLRGMQLPQGERNLDRQEGPQQLFLPVGSGAVQAGASGGRTSHPAQLAP